MTTPRRIPKPAPNIRFITAGIEIVKSLLIPHATNESATRVATKTITNFAASGSKLNYSQSGRCTLTSSRYCCANHPESAQERTDKISLVKPRKIPTIAERNNAPISNKSRALSISRLTKSPILALWPLLNDRFAMGSHHRFVSFAGCLRSCTERPKPDSSGLSAVHLNCFRFRVDTILFQVRDKISGIFRLLKNTDLYNETRNNRFRNRGI